MELNRGWAFVASYNGKKVKKYVITCEELNKHEWITETKFWFRDEIDTYCEGVVLAKEDNEQTLREMITKKNPRCPYNAFNPFPDPNVRPIDMVKKWKKRLTTIAMNDLSIPQNCHKALNEKEIPSNQVAETTSVENIIHNERNKSTISNKPEKSKVDNHMSFKETKLRQEEESMGSALMHLQKINAKPTYQPHAAKTSSEMSSEEDELLFHSKNKDMQFIKKRKKTYLFAKPEKRVINHRFIIYPNQQKKNKEETPNEDMVSKKKYLKLLQKYKFLSAILVDQRNQYAKDLQIQHLAECLYKTIEKRYNKEVEEESEED